MPLIGQRRGSRMPFVVHASAVVQFTKIVADPSRSATSSTIVTESDFGVDGPSRNLNPSTPSQGAQTRQYNVRSFRIRSNITEGALQATRGDASPTTVGEVIKEGQK